MSEAHSVTVSTILISGEQDRILKEGKRLFDKQKMNERTRMIARVASLVCGVGILGLAAYVYMIGRHTAETGTTPEEIAAQFQTLVLQLKIALIGVVLLIATAILDRKARGLGAMNLELETEIQSAAEYYSFMGLLKSPRSGFDTKAAIDDYYKRISR